MAWSVSDMPSQHGRLAVVTGTGGLGYETAVALARAGAEVILAGRNAAKGEASAAQIAAAAPGAVIRFEVLDLASLSSVEDFSRRLGLRAEKLDLLINNAGVMMPPARQTTADGFELQFGTNYLGHFALTAHLLPLLRKAAAPRVVNVTSKAYEPGKISFDDLQAERAYSPFRAYAQSKLAQLMFAQELQRRSDREGWGIMSNAAHPGWARTDLFQNGPGSKSFSNLLNTLVAPILGQSGAAGALPTLYAATAAEASGGALYGPSGPLELKGPPARVKILPSAAKRDLAEELWRRSQALTGTENAWSARSVPADGAAYQHM